MNEIIDLIQDYGQQCEDRDMNCYDTLEKIKSRLESLEKDAARYRWLKADGEDVDVVRSRSDLFNFEWGDELDAAIDAATQANKA